MKTGLTVKGGNVTRLGLLDRILDLTDKLVTPFDGEDRRYLSEEELISTTQVYKAVAETISTVNTNGQGIMVTNCNFTGMEMGMKIEQSPEEHLEESTQEGIIEEVEEIEKGKYPYGIETEEEYGKFIRDDLMLKEEPREN